MNNRTRTFVGDREVVVLSVLYTRGGGRMVKVQYIDTLDVRMVSAGKVRYEFDD